MNAEWRRRTRQEREAGSILTVSCSCPWRPWRLMASWPFGYTVAIGSPTIGERWPSVGERTPAFGERLPLFGERLPTFGERNPLISGFPVKPSTVRESKRSKPRANGDHWRAKSAPFRSFCHIFKDLEEWSSKIFFAQSSGRRTIHHRATEAQRRRF